MADEWFHNIPAKREKFPAGSAIAHIRGSQRYPDIEGTAVFLPAMGGSWVEVDVRGLPPFTPAQTGRSPIGPFGFHLHQGDSCEPMGGMAAFSNAMGHYNPDDQPHGNHAGDFPVLFSNNGKTRMGFYTRRFTPEQIVGRTVMIHLNPDDYRTDPAGNSGERIACGVVEPIR